MKNQKIIKWTNIHSGETGYVKMIRPTSNHFINTFDPKQARKYRSFAEATKAIAALCEMGEGDFNRFDIVE